MLHVWDEFTISKRTGKEGVRGGDRCAWLPVGTKGG